MIIENISLTRIRPSKTNPRKHFDEAYIGALSDSIRAKGILQPLTARPDWCLGKTDEEIAEYVAKLNGAHSASSGQAAGAPAEFFEIVAGECRYRGGVKAELSEAPVIVRLLSDKEALEIQLIENLQRSDLTPLEEAEGYRRLLDDYGYTVELIHEKTGKTTRTIYGKLKMLKAPKILLDAMAKDLVGEGHCELVGRIPFAEMRESAAREILQPEFLQETMQGGLTAIPDQPMSLRVARGHVRENYMRSLAGAQFDQADAGLVDVINDSETGERIGGGACTDCPMRSGNRPELLGDLKRPDICTNPKCFAQKTDSYFVRLQENAAKEGKKLLSDEEAAREFEVDGSLSFRSRYVKLSEQPAIEHCREGVKRSSWKKLLEGCESKPEIVVARDPKGRVVEMVDFELAREAVNLAAKAKGETSIFQKKRDVSSGGRAAAASGGIGDAGSEEEEPAWKKQERKNREIAKLNFEITLAAMSDLIGKIDQQGAVKGFWDALIKISIDHAGPDGAWLICKRNALDPKKGKRVDGIAGEGVEGAALEYGLSLVDDNMKLGFVVELLLSQRVKIYNSGSMGGVRTVAAFKEFAKLYKVDVNEIEKRVRSEVRGRRSEVSKKMQTPKLPNGYARALEVNAKLEVQRKEAPPIEHKWEQIAGVKYRCKNCGASAVRSKGKMVVAKEFRGKPCVVVAKKAKKPRKTSSRGKRKGGVK